MTKSKFIVLEGLDGCGKETQTGLLRDRLAAEGKRVRVIDFPNYKSESSALVRFYLDGGLGDSPDCANAYAASMFFAADRYISYVTDWKRDYLDTDTVIIANRYTTANAYHQTSKLPRGEWDSFLDWLWDFEYGKLGLPSPDRVILLDMPERVSERLVIKRSGATGTNLDIHERDEGYLESCRRAAAYVAKKCGWTVVKCADEDGTAPYARELIAESVRSALSDIL